MKTLTAFILLIHFWVAGNSQTVTSSSLQELEKRFSTSSKDLLIVNFWATYCKPCVTEMPDLIKVAEKYPDKVELLLVSLDDKSIYPKKLRQFIKKHKITSTVIWLNETDPNYFCYQICPDWQGSIPATLFIDKKNGKKHFKETELTASELEEIVQRMGN